MDSDQVFVIYIGSKSNRFSLEGSPFKVCLSLEGCVSLLQMSLDIERSDRRRRKIIIEKISDDVWKLDWPYNTLNIWVKRCGLVFDSEVGVDQTGWIESYKIDN